MKEVIKLKNNGRIEFETLHSNKHRIRFLIGFVCVVVLLTVFIIGRSHARYRVTESIPLVNGTINYSLADLNIVAITVDGEASNIIPEGNYELTEDSYCTVNGEEDSSISISYEADTQLLTVTPFTTKGTKCYLDFVEISTAIDTIEELYPNNSLAYDDFNNLRYIGANPNNYVSFNNELWRIIGIFSEDTHGVKGDKLIKIIRSESLGNFAWDSSVNNNWSTSSLQFELNGDYLNGTGSYTSLGIKDNVSRNMIETVTWKLGGTESSINVLASHFYNYERETNVYGSNPITWSGKVALMYPSDYSYATSGGSMTSREMCLSSAPINWLSSDYSDCKNNNWLYDSSITQWTLTPATKYNSRVFDIISDGTVNVGLAYGIFSIRPSIYLMSTVVIMNGDGSQSNPFQLSIN